MRKTRPLEVTIEDARILITRTSEAARKLYRDADRRDYTHELIAAARGSSAKVLASRGMTADEQIEAGLL